MADPDQQAPTIEDVHWLGALAKIIYEAGFGGTSRVLVGDWAKDGCLTIEETRNDWTQRHRVPIKYVKDRDDALQDILRVLRAEKLGVAIREGRLVH